MLYCSHCGQARVKPQEQQQPPPSQFEDGEACPACSRKQVAVESDGEEENDRLEDIYSSPSNHGSLNLTDPPEHRDLVYGYVERYRGPHVHTFHFYREGDGSFVLACSMSASQTGALYFHTKQTLFNRAETVLADVPSNHTHPGFIAQLLPNSLLGTDFLLTNKPTPTAAVAAANRPKSKDYLDEEALLDEQQRDDHHGAARAHQEFALFIFSTNLTASQPNQVKAWLRAYPRSRHANAKLTMRQRVNQVAQTRAPTNFVSLWFDRLRRGGGKGRAEQDTAFYYDSLEQQADGEGEEEVLDKDDVLLFLNRKPGWNATIGGWTLDFNGRVTMSSKKNFILVASNDVGDAPGIGARFGKVAKHRFNLDYRFPFSPLSAMALSMSMFSQKFAVA